MPPTGALVAPELDGDTDDEATAALLASLALPLVRRRAPRAWRQACNRWTGRRYASRGRTRLDRQMYKLEGRWVQTNAYDVHGL
jgi:hypothetical protein